MAVLGAAAGGGALPQITINKSQTWVPPQDGVVCIHVVGAGGSGASATTYYGGGAGAYAKIPSLAVTTAGSFTLVVGVGGAGTLPSGNGQYSNGINGGNSTIAGTGITGTLTCQGGRGGTTSANGAGGTVSGSANEGWAGYSGGAGDRAGGAVGIYATGNTTPSGQPYWAPITDAASGGLAMSGYGTICGGQKGGMWVYNNGNGTGPDGAGDDLCGGGYAFTNSTNKGHAGNGGVGGGGGGIRGSDSSGLARSGSGGNGIILIHYLS